MTMTIFIVLVRIGIAHRAGGGDQVSTSVSDMIGVTVIGDTTLRTTAIGITHTMVTTIMDTTHIMIGATLLTYRCITEIMAMDMAGGMAIQMAERPSVEDQ